MPKQQHMAQQHLYQQHVEQQHLQQQHLHQRQWQQRQQQQSTGWEDQAQDTGMHEAQVWRAEDSCYPELDPMQAWFGAKQSREQPRQQQYARSAHPGRGHVPQDFSYGGQMRQQDRPQQHTGMGAAGQGMRAQSSRHYQYMPPAHLDPTFHESSTYAQRSQYAAPRHSQQPPLPPQEQMYGGTWQGDYEDDAAYLRSAVPAQPYIYDRYAAGDGQMRAPQTMSRADGYSVPMRSNQV